MRRTLGHMLAMASLTTLIASPGLVAQATFGVKGGLALANVYGDAVGNAEHRSGFTGGAFLDIALTSSLYLSPQVLYTQKGTRERGFIDIGVGPTLTDGTWEYGYLDFMALLKRRFGRGGVGVDLYAGASYSVLLSAKVVGEGGEIDVKDLSRSNDAGVVIGGSVRLAGGLLFDLAYSIAGLEFDEPPLIAFYGRKHKVVSAMLGFTPGTL
ncbi:MAG: porin family protein [Gemmatimonadota bacterium]